MTVAYNSQLSSSNVNNAFASKSANNTLVGVLDLNNATSGDQIANVQQKINDIEDTTENLTWSMTANQTVVAGGTINNSTSDLKQYRRIDGDAGAITASSTPFGSAGGWVDGIEIRLVGTHLTNSVSFVSNDAQYGMILNGDCTLLKYNILTVQYDSTLERFIEVQRNF